MKQIFRILIISILCLPGIAPLHAQWEQIGWQGGQVDIEAQLGNTLYSSNNNIYKSTDWGKTWIPMLNSLPSNPHLWGGSFVINGSQLLVDLSQGYNSYSDTSEFGMYYCTENENILHYKKLSLIKGIAPSILSWSADSMFATRKKNVGKSDIDDGLYFSTNGGNSWELRITTVQNDFLKIADPYIFRFVNWSQLFRSDDFGVTWKKIKIPTGDTISINLIYLRDNSLMIQSFPQPGDTSPIFYLSTNNGNTWKSMDVIFPNGKTIAGHFFGEKVRNKIFIHFLVSPYANLSYESADEGSSWHLISFQDSLLQVGEVFGKDNYYLLSTNKGNFTTDSSFSILTPLFSTGIFTNQRKLVCVSNKKLFVLTDGDSYYTISSILHDSLLVSTDNGSTWQQELFFNHHKLDYNRWVEDGTNIYASGINKDSTPCIFHTTDEGNTWSIAATLSTKDIISQFFVSGDTIIVKQASNLLASIDGGKSWTVIKNTLFGETAPLCYKNGVFMIPSQGGIDYSSDFGSTWEQLGPWSSEPTESYGVYIFGPRLLAAFGFRNGYALYFLNAHDNTLRVCKGLDSNLLFIPSCDEHGIIYSTGAGLKGNAPSQGHTALYYSFDSGANWKQLGDYVTNSPDVFIGSDYIFLAGPTELWRGPKPTIPAGVTPTQSSASISITECYPNPARSEMHISYSIPRRSEVTLSLYDMTGKEIQTIMNESRDAGSNEKMWDVKSLPSGSYILKLSASGESVTKVIEVLK